MRMPGTGMTLNNTLDAWLLLVSWQSWLNGKSADEMSKILESLVEYLWIKMTSPSFIKVINVTCVNCILFYKLKFLSQLLFVIVIVSERLNVLSDNKYLKQLQDMQVNWLYLLTRESPERQKTDVNTGQQQYVIMACILIHFSDTTIKIPNYHLVDGTTFYDIHVTVGKVNWTVQHRFKEFVELNEKLVTGHSISSDLLPPKKVRKISLANT